MMNIHPIKKDRKRFWCLLGLLILLIMVRYAFQTDIPPVVFLLFIGLIVLLGDRDEVIAMLICCIPLHESVDFFYALAISVGIYVFKYHKLIKFSTNILLIFIVVVWELLHCFRTSFSPVDFLSGIVPFIVLAVIIASNTSQVDYPFIVRAFSWTALSVSLVLFMRVLYFSGFDFLLAIAGLQRIGLDPQSNVQDVTITGGLIHPTSLGIITVLAATGLMQLRSAKVNKRSDMILLCIILLLAALGASRTYLACLAMMIVLLILAERGGAKKKLQLIAVLCLAIATATVAMAFLFPDTFEYFVSRFFEADITTGRDSLMLLYHRFIADHPNVMFFGIGLQDFSNRLINVYRVANNVPHNSLQEIVVAWGVQGLFLFGALIVSMLLASGRQNTKRSLINWIPLIIILFKSMAGQMLTSYYTMLAFSYAYLSLSADLTPKQSALSNEVSDD